MSSHLLRVEAPIRTAYRDLPRPRPVVAPGAPLSQLIEAMLANRGRHAVYVVDDRGRLEGFVSRRDIRAVFNRRLGIPPPGGAGRGAHARRARTAADLLRLAPRLTPDSPLRDALQAMEDLEVDRVPVTTRARVLLGEIAEEDCLELALDIALAAEHARAKPDDSGAFP